MQTIENILTGRSAFLKGSGGDKQMAEQRRDLTMAVQQNYPAFEVLRDKLLGIRSSENAGQSDTAGAAVSTADTELLFDHLWQHELLKLDQGEVSLNNMEARRFVTGGWLEELAWLAVMEAGAHEAHYSQLVGWDVEGYTGENEIDVIFRRDDKLGFVSCKALRSSLQSSDRKHRARMMDAVHEADNLADHFGQPGERVGVLVTTDLFDEERGEARYQALMGKAAVLDVRVIPLEDIRWDKLVGVMEYLMDH
ncbi:MAG: Card1-like endonuclease domain-containing protein [Anderseniella sp.]